MCIRDRCILTAYANINGNCLRVQEISSFLNDATTGTMGIEFSYRMGLYIFRKIQVDLYILACDCYNFRIQLAGHK